MTTQAAQVRSYEALINVLYRNCPYPEQGADILKLSYKIFHVCNAKTGGSSLAESSNAPLWHNSQLKEIAKVPDGACWAVYGVKYAHQLFRDGIEYAIPNTFFFRYLQLRHAAMAQYGRGEVTLSPSNMEKLISLEDHSKLISRYYFALLTSSSPRMERVAAQWKTDIPSLMEETWSEVLDTMVPSIISARDKMLQFNYLHRIYYTPKRFDKMGRRESPERP